MGGERFGIADDMLPADPGADALQKRGKAGGVWQDGPGGMAGHGGTVPQGRAGSKAGVAAGKGAIIIGLARRLVYSALNMFIPSDPEARACS